MQAKQIPSKKSRDDALIQLWVAWLQREKGRSSSTLRLYEREVRRLGTYGSLEQLQVQDLRRCLMNQGGRPGTIANRIQAFRSFYDYLAQNDFRTDNPARKLDRPRVPLRLPRPVKEPERLFAKLDAVDARVDGRRVGESRDIAVFLRETGLRISEACRLNVSTPIPDLIRIHGKGGKERMVPLTLRAQAALQALGGHMPLGPGGNPIGPRAIQRRFEKAGFSPMQLRHTLGTELAMSNADLGEIQDLLGHASPQTTRIYTAYSTDRLRKAQERRLQKFGSANDD